MSQHTKRLITPILLAGVISLLIVGGVFAARKGNIIDEVNYNGVLDGQIRVCNQSTGLPNDALAWGVLQWNEAVGKSIVVVDCGGTRGVTVLDEPLGGLCGNAPACADNPKVQQRTQLGLYVTPLGAGYLLDDQQAFTVHELGHNLGFDHWPYSGTCVSIMHFHDCIYTSLAPEPQQTDINNYATAYTVDPPSGLSGTSPAVGQVNLSWNASQIFNEASFAIYSAPQGTSNWVIVGSAGQDQGSKTLTGQAGGPYQFAVGGWTGAYCGAYGGYCAAGPAIPLTVQGLPDLKIKSFTPPSCSTCTAYGDEGGTQAFTVTVQNVGNVKAGPSTVVLKFDDKVAPNTYGGLCNVGEIAAGGTATCTTYAVNLTIPGGHIDAIADYNNTVVESDESTASNVLTYGTLGVKPKKPTNVRAVPPYAAYAWTDQSVIETQFKLELERRSSCTSGTWNPVPGKDTEGHTFPYNHPALSGSGTDHIMLYSYAHGYCYRLRVTPKSQFGGDGTRVTSSTWWYP